MREMMFLLMSLLLYLIMVDRDIGKRAVTQGLGAECGQ